MKTEIVIATRNRYDKLVKCLDSIPAQYPIHLICDGDLGTYRRLLAGKRNFASLLYNEISVGAVASRNILFQYCFGNVIYATDDMTFNEGSIEEAESMLLEHYPDTDGVIGFTQTGNKKFHPSGVALVGQKFFFRYPGKQIFNPNYYHFACQEVYWFADKLGKFYPSDTAIINHMNPMVEGQKHYMDQTHHDGRIHRKRDHDLINSRMKAGEIWGM